MRTLPLIPIVLALGCGRGGSEAAHDDHGHGAAAAAAELPGQSVTTWAERTELFMEYPPLIVGREARFAAHVTEMPTFRAVTSGRATLTVIYAGGAEVSGAVDAPSNPGIFRPVLTPSKAGPCELRFTIASPQVSETFAAGPCEVFADEAAARAKLGEEAEVPGRITFLKEQQWKTDFATVAASEQDLQDGVRATGEIRPVAGREAEVGAPVAGRVSLSEPAPILGMPVVAGPGARDHRAAGRGRRRSRDDGRRRRRRSRRGRGGPRRAGPGRAAGRRSGRAGEGARRGPDPARDRRGAGHRRPRVGWPSSTPAPPAVAVPGGSSCGRRSPARWSRCRPRRARTSTRAGRCSR